MSFHSFVISTRVFRRTWLVRFATLASLLFGAPAWALGQPESATLAVPAAATGDASLVLPVQTDAIFNWFGLHFTGGTILWLGMGVCALGVIYGLVELANLRRLPAHPSMLAVSTLIYRTCRTYLLQQAKLLVLLEILIGATMVFYFGYLQQMPAGQVAIILAWSVVGVAGSFGVAWFGVAINNVANSRMAFASLRGRALPLSEIPMRSGMSIGVLLISVELVLMLTILHFVNPKLAGLCFVGFAIGESLGASVLRVCGGIFTKIADIGSDMMKIVFHIKEDDARNPGVIADCAGDNAGDSVGPTADGFETYGVTGVALISFICLAVHEESRWPMLVWIFSLFISMVVVSIVAWFITRALTKALMKDTPIFNFEHPLTLLVWLTSGLCIATTFVLSYLMLHEAFPDLWWKLATIVSCGTLAAAVIPELTRVFTSMHSKHCHEVVNATKEGGAGLTILSGLVAGKFSAFWMGLTLLALMLIGFKTGAHGLTAIMDYPSVFAFGLIAFGMLGMGPVTIAVDSYGPVTDNAQSIFELSTIEQLPDIANEIERTFGFRPDFATGKHFLEANDGAGNTFKATAKPVLIGTAVVGATTMIFSLILMLKQHEGWTDFDALSITSPWVLMGMLAGGAVVHWFCGASMQAVTTGAYRAVSYIRRTIKLDGVTKASDEDSNEVVRICTKFAQYGMINIFVVIFSLTLGFAFVNPVFFVAYLLSLALFGLFAAVYMANAGGCWDNAKKLVEVELRQKGTPLHDATVIGDLVGDPFKDTSSVALNPLIKFTTLFGILAVEIAINAQAVAPYFAAAFIALGLVFVWRSFYGMRITNEN
jgi:K(+)-stimulated pyrophosphate-energized sodium pump